MRLWYLAPHKRWTPWYDKAFGFVVRAESEADARKLAQSNSGDEARHKEVWLDGTLTTCDPLEDAGPEGVVLRDFASA